MATSGNPIRRRLRTDARHIYFVVCIFSICPVSGCEEDPPLPPTTPQPAAPAMPELDVQHLFQFKADRTLVIPNMIFVLQRDAGGEDIGLSLTSSRPASDGSTVIIGEFVMGGAKSKLVGTEVRLRGSKLLTGVGSLIRTPTAVYKPQDAILLLTSMEDGEAAGTIRGTFYRFASPQASMTRPTEVEVDASFKALLIVR